MERLRFRIHILFHHYNMGDTVDQQILIWCTYSWSTNFDLMYIQCKS